MNGKLAIKGAALIAAMGMASLAPLPATASTLLGYFTGQGNLANDCAGVFGTPPNCVASYTDPDTGDVLLEPTPLIAKIDYPGGVTLGNFASITGNEFTVTFNSDGSGSWTYNPVGDDPEVTAFVIKDGNGFWLFGSSGLTGSWTKDQQQGGQGVSHITFYDGGEGPPFEVPEPAALGLLGLGLASMALVRRRRK